MVSKVIKLGEFGDKQREILTEQDITIEWQLDSMNVWSKDWSK